MSLQRVSWEASGIGTELVAEVSGGETLTFSAGGYSDIGLGMTVAVGDVCIFVIVAFGIRESGKRIDEGGLVGMVLYGKVVS